MGVAMGGVTQNIVLQRSVSRSKTETNDISWINKFSITRDKVIQPRKRYTGDVSSV